MLSSLDEVKSVKVESVGDETLILVERYPILSRVNYRGLRSFSDAELNAYLGLLRDIPLKDIDEESIKLRLEEFYKDRGFLDVNARVSISIDSSGFATILAELSEGPLYFTLGVEISGDNNLKTELTKILKPVRGRVFREGEFREEVFKLQDYLIERGYFDAFVYYSGVKKLRIERPFFEVILPGEEKLFNRPLKLLGSISEGFNNLFEHPVWTLRALSGGGFGAYAVYTVLPGKRYEIRFEGAKNFAPELLLKKTGFKQTGVDPFAAERASLALEEFYRSKGFFDVRVRHSLLPDGVFFEIEEGDRYFLNLNGEIVGFYEKEFLEKELESRLNELKSQGFVLAEGKTEISISRETRTVFANFVIDRGPKQFIKSIKLETQDERIRNKFSAIEKKLPILYDSKFLEELIMSIKKDLGERGFLKPSIEQEVIVEDFEDEVYYSYIYKISPGERFSLGETVFYGYLKTAGNEVSYMNTKGDFYSDRLTENALYNFLRSGIFSGVEIKTFLDEKNKRVHRLIILSEEERGAIDLSLGYNTEEKFFLEGVFTLKNLFGIGASSVFSFRKSSREERFKLEFGDEFFFSSRLFLKAFLNKAQEERRNYSTDSKVGGLQIGFRVGRDFSIGLTQLFGHVIAQKKRFGVAKTTAFAIFERKDDIINPRRLSISDFRLSRSFSGEKFWKLEFSHFELLPLQSDLSLIFKVSGGGISGDAPIFEKFFLGGLKDLRGFEFESIGPGDVFAFSRFETQKTIKSPIVGAIFVDSGSTSRNFRGVFKAFKYNFGAGIGVSTPLGPARFDLSYAPQRGKFSISLSVGYFY
ncbi:MAG: POTRA domain-containing protein [Aquificaceae bacterium]